MANPSKKQSPSSPMSPEKTHEQDIPSVKPNEGEGEGGGKSSGGEGESQDFDEVG